MKKSDITVVTKRIDQDEDVSRFGVIKCDSDGRITDFDEKPFVASSNLISTGIYVIRRRHLIELIEKAASEERFDFVRDILVRYKDIKNLFL